MIKLWLYSGRRNPEIVNDSLEAYIAGTLLCLPVLEEYQNPWLGYNGFELSFGLRFPSKLSTVFTNDQFYSYKALHEMVLIQATIQGCSGGISIDRMIEQIEHSLK